MRGDQLAPLRALNDLIDSARWRENVARFHDWADLEQGYAACATQLDAVRTMLVPQEGHTYTPEAWAFVDAGRIQLYRFGMVEELR